MKEWYKEYDWFYEKWWKENKDEIIPEFLEKLTPEDKASHSEEEWVEWIKEKYRECVIEQCFGLEHYRETHREEWEKEFQENKSKIGEMLYTHLMWK